MKNRLLILTLIASFSGLSSKSFASSPRDDVAAQAAEQAVGLFASARGVDPNKPSMSFIGFSSVKKAGGADVQVVSQLDGSEAWIDLYDCTGGTCVSKPGLPRCFYVPDSRLFSIADIAEAVRWSQDVLSRYHGDNLEFKKLKFWQTGPSVFARVVFAAPAGADQEALFQCQKTDDGLSCGKASAVENEP